MLQVRKAMRLRRLNAAINFVKKSRRTRHLVRRYAKKRWIELNYA